MSEKLPPLSELVKLAAENGVELPDDIAETVAGGEYTYEEWINMSVSEQQAAQRRSAAARILKTVCELDPGVDPHNM